MEVCLWRHILRRLCTLGTLRKLLQHNHKGSPSRVVKTTVVSKPKEFRLGDTVEVRKGQILVPFDYILVVRFKISNSF